MLADVDSLGWRMGSLDIILKGDHLSTTKSVWSQLAKQFQLGGDLNIFPIGSFVKTMSVDVVSLGWQARSSDIILKGDHPRIIPPKFGPNRPSSFREEDF